MKTSLLDIAHPHPKYNFRPYWSDSYGMLKHLIMNLRAEEQSLREKSVTSGVDENGAPFITFESEEVLSRLQKLHAEIRYMERLIRFRRFWRPRDWFYSLQTKCSTIWDKMQRHIKQRRENRIARMNNDKRIAYYRKRVQIIEKKIIAIYDKYSGLNNDCSFIPAGIIGGDKELKEKLEPLLHERTTILDAMFQATPEELKRLTELNDQLRRHVEFMKEQLTDFYRANAAYSRGKDLDEWIEANLEAYPLLTESYPGDDFYGSDFDKILGIEYELMDEGLSTCEWLRIYPDDNPDYDADNLIIDGYDRYQGDDDWTEYWRKCDALRDIKFCHALHHMSDHQNLPLVDILHKTAYSIELKHDITISKEQFLSVN